MTVTVIEYEWNDNTTERIVAPTDSEIFGLTDWMLGDKESRDILRQAGLKNITITVRAFKLEDIDYMGLEFTQEIVEEIGRFKPQEVVDDVAIDAEKLRVATTEAQEGRRKKLPYHERKIVERWLAPNKTYPRNQLILNYDDEVVACFNSVEERTNAFRFQAARKLKLKAHIEKQIQDYTNKYKTTKRE